jgi:molybdenum ABC transporter molybdate-binding protein
MAIFFLMPQAARADIIIAAPLQWAPIMNALLEKWQSAGGNDVKMIYGHSDDQAIQIEVGNSFCDLFITAEPQAIYRVLSRGKIAEPIALASSPVVLVFRESGSDIAPVLDARFAASLPRNGLAIPDPDSDGVGALAREALSQTGLWEMMQKKILVIPGGSQAVARAVKSGQVPFGIVMRSDEAAVGGLREGVSLRGDQPPPDLTFVMAALTPALRPEVQHFVQFLLSPSAANIMAAKGLTPQITR